MAVKKTAQKSSRRASLNIPESGSKSTKKGKKAVERKIKKSSPLTICLAVVFLIIGLGGGYLAYWLTSKNDCFTLVGRDEITLTLEEEYEDEGVKIIEFGKDISKNAVYATNLKERDGKFYSDEVGTFYIKYTVDSFKYGKIAKIEKVRLITYVEASEGGE